MRITIQTEKQNKCVLFVYLSIYFCLLICCTIINIPVTKSKGNFVGSACSVVWENASI